MARQEIDREDLLKEATALVRRVEFQDSRGRVVVAGLRANGAGSIYFDAEPTFQFNDRGQFRRAYQDGRLWKAEQGKLVALERQRTDTKVFLRRTELDATRQLQWLSVARSKVLEFREQLAAGAWTVTGAVPDSAKALPQISRWLEAIVASPWQVARRPRVTSNS